MQGLQLTQIETECPAAESGKRKAESGKQEPGTCAPAFGFRLSAVPRRGFTLTELLIVIAIIAVLAGLITAAAVNALRAANRAAIIDEINKVGGALEAFNTEFGAYPPNAMNNGDNQTIQQVSNDLVRAMKRAFPRIDAQELQVVQALAGMNVSGNVVTSGPVQGGVSAYEALVFWLGGFSDDARYPLSGPGGPSFVDTNSNGDEILEDRNRRYQFELTRLIPRNSNGGFDESDRRFVEYQIDLNGNGNNNDAGERRQINLWQYAPQGSEQPLMYFDVSRYKPAVYDPPANFNVTGADQILALKKVREGRTQPQNLNDVVFVNQDKFQILHCGLDGAWGSFGSPVHLMSNVIDLFMLFPTGPFIGDTADTLTNFTSGVLEDAAEQ